MNLQFLTNPTKGSRKKRKSLIKKKRNPKKSIVKTGKILTIESIGQDKPLSKDSLMRRKARRKNPTSVTAKVKDKKTGKIIAKGTAKYNNRKDLAQMTSAAEALKQRKYKAKKRATKKRLGKKINTLTKKRVSDSAKAKATREILKKDLAEARADKSVSVSLSKEFTPLNRRKKKKKVAVKRKKKVAAKRKKKVSVLKKKKSKKVYSKKRKARKASAKKASSYAKRKKVKVMKRTKKKTKKKTKLKVNPIFGGNMNLGKVTGHSGREMGFLVGAGALVDVVGAAALKVPGMDKLQELVGRGGAELQAASGSVITLLLASIANVMLEKHGKGQVKVLGAELSKSLVAASLVKIGGAFSGTVMKASGLSGVIYTPLSGVRFTPLSGSHATPQLGMTPGLFKADFGKGFDVSDYGGGGGYTDSRRHSKADFGYPQMGNVDFTPMSNVDFTPMSGDDEPVLDQTMGMC